MLRVAAVVQALEAIALCVVAVAQVVETAAGHSYQASNGVALAATEFITVALIAWIASGIARVRPWSRTPAVMTQLGGGLLAIIFLQAGRYDWGAANPRPGHRWASRALLPGQPQGAVAPLAIYPQALRLG